MGLCIFGTATDVNLYDILVTCRYVSCAALVDIKKPICHDVALVLSLALLAVLSRHISKFRLCMPPSVLEVVWSEWIDKAMSW